MSTSPLVTIGMPVRNEDQHIREAVESLLAQDFQDFVLVISDNASTDGTEDVCRQLAKQDSRVKYRRHRQNVGSLKNFNSVAMECPSRYFLWSSGHDLSRPQFLSRCVKALEEDENVVLAYPRAVLVDGQGRERGLMPGGVDTRGLGKLRRVWATLVNMPNGNPLYGVIRASALDRTPLTRPVISADIILLSELALQGSFACLEEPLWCRRESLPAQSAFNVVRRQSAMLFGGEQRRGILSAYLHLVGTHTAALVPGPGQPLLSLTLLGIILLRYSLVVPWRWLLKKQGAVRIED